MTQLSFNAKESKTIKITLFFANYKRKFNLFCHKESSMLIKIAKNKMKILKRIHENILKMQQRFENYVNKKRKQSIFIEKK